MTSEVRVSELPPVDDELVDGLLKLPEGPQFETKRLGGDKLTRVIESVVAMANSDGGHIVLGVEDRAKATGRDRVYGIQEKPENVDEVKRLIVNRITPRLPGVLFREIGCTLRDGRRGTLVVILVRKGDEVYSIVADGTWVRETRSNRELVAEEITALALERGTISAETRPHEVPFELLDGEIWRRYAAQRRLTRPIADAMEILGLARRSASGRLCPTAAALLLFAENPGGLMGSKAGIRVFHYRGEEVEHSATTNLLKPPFSFSGPILRQILDAGECVLRELASGIQLGPLGFEVVQRYPVRVIREAITNAVIHRDYSVPADIQVRLFADRIEVESPGGFPRNVTSSNIRSVGSVSRNPLLVSNLREFPEPPNLDAGEGVRMMFATMEGAGLYPPLYVSRATGVSGQVVVTLRNEHRPSAWDEIQKFIARRGSIGNAEVREVLRTADTLAVSKLLGRMVEVGLLVPVDRSVGKRSRRYRFPNSDPVEPLFSPRLRKEADSSP